MKRFTETLKWADPWFRKLEPPKKLLWQWLCDQCDGAGFINPDWQLAEFQIGSPVCESDLESFDGRIEKMQDGSLWIRQFIKFQYGKLSRECKTHNFVFAALERRGIDPTEVEMSETRGKNGIPQIQRLRIIKRDGLICAYSGSPVPLDEVEIDHVTPKVSGGTDADDNLVVASKEMNQLKKDKSVERFCSDSGLDFKAVTNRIIERLSIDYSKPIQSPQDKVKETDSVKDTVRESGSKFKKPSIEEVKLHCSKAGISMTDAEWFFYKCEGNGWTNAGRPMKSWQMTLISWKTAGYLPSQKNHANNSKPNPRNAGVVGDLAENARRTAEFVARQQPKPAQTHE